MHPQVGACKDPKGSARSYCIQNYDFTAELWKSFEVYIARERDVRSEIDPSKNCSVITLTMFEEKSNVNLY